MTRPHPAFLRKFFCSLILLTAIGCAHAQSGSAADKHFGLQAGINMSAMNFNLGSPAPPTTDKLIWKPGVVLGLLLRVPLTKTLFLQPEYAFTQRNGSDKLVATDYRLDYLSLPLLLGYRISPHFSLLAGPQMELLIDARSTGEGTSTSITHDVEERGISLTGGLQADVFRSFFLSLRYLQGLNHIGIGQRSDVKEFKYQALQLTAGLRF